MSPLSRAPFRLLLRVFFRRVELAGAEHLPAGPAILALNHPSALVDPLLALALLPRPAAFLAKAPLFRVPVLGRIVRAAGAIPVHRPGDPGSDLRENVRTFEAAAAHLAAGGLLAIFPEGTSHDDPRLRSLKTGAARIALLAAPRAPGLALVPATLAFSDKGTFRSDVLLQLGAPIPVPLLPPAERDPTAVDARSLTERLARAMGELALQADRAELLGLAAFVAGVLAQPGGPVGLAERVALQREILAGAERLRARDPERIDALERRVARHARALRTFGLTPELLDVAAAGSRGARSTALRAIALAILSPIALPAIAIHLPAYRAIDRLARRLAKGDASMLATLKLLAGLLAFPLTWAGLAALGGLARGALAALAVFAAGPVLALAALTLAEGGEAVRVRARAVVLGRRSPRAVAALQAERAALRAEIVVLAGALRAPDQSTVP